MNTLTDAARSTLADALAPRGATRYIAIHPQGFVEWDEFDPHFVKVHADEDEALANLLECVDWESASRW